MISIKERFKFIGEIMLLVILIAMISTVSVICLIQTVRVPVNDSGPEQYQFYEQYKEEQLRNVSEIAQDVKVYTYSSEEDK